MAGVVVRVEGLNRLVRDLQALGLEVDDLKDAFHAVASEAGDVIRAGTPVRSGKLAASIRPNRAKSKAVVTAGRSAVPYAGAINYGWKARGIEGQHFMQRADVHNERWVALIEQGVDDAIRKRGLT